MRRSNLAKAQYESLASSRHAKITGDFAEALVLYWLSRDGFECARVDHTGIDLIARNPHTDELMGISVKGRSRLRKGSSEESITIPKDNFEKADEACQAFECTPYFAIVVDGKDENTIHLFLTSMSHLVRIFPNRKTGSFWKMGKHNLVDFSRDPEIKSVCFSSETVQWWNPIANSRS
jgi:hypothetical protein